MSSSATFALLLLTFGLLLPSFAQVSRPGTPADRLHALIDEEWNYEMRTNPETATSYGDNRFNDRLSDFSLRAIAADLHEKQNFLTRFEAIPANGLSETDQLNRTLMVRRLKDELDGAKFKPWEMPIDQFGGVHLWYAMLPSLTPFQNARDFQNYLSRLHQLPRVFDEVMANARHGMHDHLMPPGYLLDQVVPQAESIANNAGDSNPFAQPLKKLDGLPRPEQERFRREIMDAIQHEVLPAYARLAKFVRDDYAPNGRKQDGVWSLPDGDARYRYDVRRMTTTDLTPDQIHEVGLQEVARIEGEMLGVAHKLGFQDVAALNAHIRGDRKLYGTSSEQVLGLYQKYADQMEKELPKLFGRLPKNKLVVVPMESFREKAGVPADYTPGSPATGRPGRINVNMFDPQHRLLLNVEAIAYHEGVPGHHLQFSIAQELPALPAFRQHAEYTAFTEGWAFYAERLGKDVGFYRDPYSDYGRLENEMWRAIRLVVDTGVHSKHWSRQQMIDYFHKYTAMDEQNIQTEVDRYIAWPAQALGYKIGQMRILELREHARKELGPKFDIKAFHDEVLGAGALPLDVLETLIDSWIAAQETRK